MLIEQARTYPPRSANRQKIVAQIVAQIKPKLWKKINDPYYEDVLQQAWLYLCANLCETTTGQAYDPRRASVSSWMNFYLKHRLQDVWRDQAKIKHFFNNYTFDLTSENNYTFDLTFEEIEARPIVPPILEIVKAWVESDETGELSRIHLRGSHHVTCQLLILRRLPPETSWRELSEEFNIPIPTLSSFYRRKCMPLLRQFGESQGFL
ncbi:sigma-70 family RNA polymerase sigma factor [Oculatella sp. LEGE 06141]|nr:sigma-70 family RNA polymerase sigma factor [Oculatella sp. LEGE 06141]